jgi:formate dehydrogenase alpha subunit
VAGLATTLGAGAATNSFDQIENADTIFLFGSNPTEAHPVVSLFIKKALRKGARLIVADPRRIWMARRADVWLNLRPGTNKALINGLIHVILREGWEDREFIEKRTEGFEELKAKVQEYDLDRVEEITGVSKDKIEEAARIYSHARNAMIIYGLGVAEHRTGTENAMAISNLALVCGHIGRPSTGIMALRGQNNVQGASDIGPAPNVFPGYQPVTDPEIRAKFERAWGVRIKPEPGLKSVEMLDAAIDGRIRGLYIIGEDPAQTDPNLHHVWKALESLEFLVVQDIFHTETTRFAHVILPGASFAEKDGTFTNGERRIQLVRKAIEPIAGMAEWEVICELSTRMGYPMRYKHPSEIMDEIASLTPSYGGVSFERLERESIQWPCPTREHTGTETLYTERFLRPNGLARLVPLDHEGPGETPDEEYPLVLITGRIREHYNCGSMTRRVKGIMELVPEELLELSPEDAEELGIRNGDWVRVSSRRGEIRVRVRVTDRSQKGNVFLTFHHQNALTNLLTSGHRDYIAGTPEYKACAVRVEPV